VTLARAAAHNDVGRFEVDLQWRKVT
jgi:hypothetical protein